MPIRTYRSRGRSEILAGGSPDSRSNLGQIDIPLYKSCQRRLHLSPLELFPLELPSWRSELVQNSPMCSQMPRPKMVIAACRCTKTRQKPPRSGTIQYVHVMVAPVRYGTRTSTRSAVASCPHVLRGEQPHDDGWSNRRRQHQHKGNRTHDASTNTSRQNSSTPREFLAYIFRLSRSGVGIAYRVSTPPRFPENRET